MPHITVMPITTRSHGWLQQLRDGIQTLSSNLCSNSIKKLKTNAEKIIVVDVNAVTQAVSKKMRGPSSQAPDQENHAIKTIFF